MVDITLKGNTVRIEYNLEDDADIHDFVVMQRGIDLYDIITDCAEKFKNALRDIAEEKKLAQDRLKPNRNSEGT